MADEERRAAGVQRVPVQTVVEMCGRDVTGAPAFAAESVDVSGRGLHVRTAYLPDVGSELVCRLEDRGREIIAEGVVVWRVEEARGGEFGLMFTAVDSGSVSALRELCGGHLEVRAPEGESAEDGRPGPAGPGRYEPGCRLRLHIDGLGAPMKALVREAATRKLKVGSNLEFLKVGRHLDIESVSPQGRRGAVIDALDILIDPQTGVPQLVVSLCYDDVDVQDTTPEPSVVDQSPVADVSAMADDGPLAVASPQSPSSEASAPRSRVSREPTSSERAFRRRGPQRPRPEHAVDEPDRSGSARADAHLESRVCEDVPFRLSQDSDPMDEDEPSGSPDPADEVVQEANALRGRVGAAAVSAGHAAQQGGEALARLGASSAQRMGRLFKDASTKLVEFGRRPRTQARTPRTTRAPAEGSVALEGRRLRPQNGGGRDQPSPSGSETPQSRTKQPTTGARRVAAAVALGVTMVGVGAVAWRSPGEPPGGKASRALSHASAMAATSPQAGQPSPAASAQVDWLTAAAPSSSQGITVDVPLFGPTPMATKERAPWGLNAVGVPNALLKRNSAPAAADRGPAVTDDVLDDRPAASVSRGEPVHSQQGSQKGTTDWRRGTVRRPTIHRLRLDAPGTSFQPEANARGFSVMIPGRKVMESPRGIAKRDARIATVSSQNTSAGARVTFKFHRGQLPGYRIRLRKDFVQFLISEPGK
ncbi:PilZ domain-containing protein [Myxococcota bacterium]